MVNYEKLLAGAIAGIGAILLIIYGYVSEGSIILSGMMGFFIGDQNGYKEANKELAVALEAATRQHDKEVHDIK